MDLNYFIKKYFINSIVYKEGYNPVNTLTFAIILVIAAYFIYKFLSKRIDFNLDFALSTFPYILFGSSLRIIEDAGFVKPPMSYLLMSPFIYIIVFLITFSLLLISLRINYSIYKYMGIILSLLVLSFLFSHLTLKNWWVFPLALAITILILIPYSLVRRLNADNFSKAVLFAQLIDGSTSFIGMQFFGYQELHVVPRFLISFTGPWIMPIVKAVVIILILYILDSSKEDIRLTNFIKFVLFTLGFAPGLRNGLRISFGV